MAEEQASLRPVGSTPTPPIPKPAQSPLLSQRASLSPVRAPIKRSTASSAPKPQLTGVSNYLDQGRGRIRTEYDEQKNMILHAPVGLAKMFGGVAIDVGEIVLQAATMGAYEAPDPENTTYGQLGKSFWKSTAGFATGARPKEYLQAWREGRPISGMIIEDAGNISILGGWLSKAFSAGAKGAAAGAAKAAEAGATAAAAEATVVAGFKQGASEAAIRDSLRTMGKAGASNSKPFAQKTAKLAAKEQRLTSVSQGLETAAKKISTVKQAADRALVYPLKPWIWGYGGISQIARTGNLSIDVTPNLTIGTDFRFWGKNAAEKYQTLLDDLRAAEPDIDATDSRYSNLLKQMSFHNRIANLGGVQAISRRAVRTGRHEATLMTQGMEEVRLSPLLKDEINPETGEVWGELTDIENQAVIAVLNGRAQLVSHLSEIDGVDPGLVADFGRYDYTEGYSLTPEGAQLAVEYVNAHYSGDTPSHPAVTKAMSPEHYARLSQAVDRIGKIMIELSNKATAGYGRKSPLDAEYFTPVPFANKLKDALRRSGAKTKNGTLFYDIFVIFEEKGYFDQPVDNQYRQDALVAFVRALPDEYALDSSMYPASMRENIEFFKRYRRSLRQDLMGVGEGDPMPSTDLPPVGPDEYRMTARKGAPGSVERLIDKVENTVDKVLAKVDKVNKKIKVAEKKYKKTAEKLQRYDIIDGFTAGRDPRYLARKYSIPIAMVREILDNSPVVKQFNRVKAIEAEIAPLEKIIGKKRAALPREELPLELQNMKVEYDRLLEELEVAKQEYSNAVEINETVRKIEESTISDAAEELYNLSDELGDIEQELIDVGGDPDQLITKEDITDPLVMPMTPGQTKAFFESVINHIDNDIAPYVDENMPDAAPDLKRSRTLLADTWNRAEKAFYEAEGEWQSHSSSMRMMQIGELYRDIEIALSSALDPDTAVQAVLDVLTDKNTLDIISGAKRPEGLLLPRTAAAARRDTIFEKVDVVKGANVRSRDGVDALYEDLKDPSVIPDLFGASTFGNTARMAEAASQLIRWIKEVQDATPKQKIELILNPPKYVDPQMARKLLTGMTRKPKDIPNATVTHPLEVFERRVLSEADSVITQLENIETFYRTYGERPKYVDWKVQSETFANRKDFPHNRLLVQDAVIIKVLDGIDYDSPTVPEIVFDKNTPAQVVVKAIDSLIKSIEADVGSRVVPGEFNPGFFDGYYVKTTGLTRKLKRYAGDAIIHLEFIKAKIESQAKPVADDFFLSKDSPRLAGVSVKKTGEFTGREQFDSFKGFASNFTKEVNDIYDTALAENGWQGWTPEELRREADLVGKFSEIFASHKYEVDTVALDQKVYDFYNSLAREERQIFFDSLSHMRNSITDAPRTQQNVKALTTLDNVIDFLTNGNFKGGKRAGLSIIEQSLEESQASATKAITTRKLKLNEKSDFVIIPCGNSKLDTAAPASEFYTGSMFQDSLRTARRLFSDDRIYIMSAKHGIVKLDKVLEPYDVKLGMEGSIDARTLADSLDEAGIEGTITSLLPKMYDKLFTEAADGRFDIDHHFEGSRGIGDQKARLSKLRDSAPDTIEAPDIPKNMQGSIELSAELEQTAIFMADNPDSFQGFIEDTANADALIRHLDEIKEPTPKELEDFKTVYTGRMQEDVNNIKGYMESNLGGSWDRGTDKITFYLTPKKGQPEWDWWFKLDGKERRYIALNHFSSTETKTGYGRGGPRYERKAEAIDSLADSVDMTPDEFGTAMVENIRQLRSAQKKTAEARKTKAEDYKEIYVDENLPEADAEAWKFAEDFGVSAEEALAIIDRVNFLTQRDVVAGDVPYALREIADSPEQVKFDMSIKNVDVRDAAYAVDLIDSMAKDAAKKMKAAGRFSERMEALQEFIDKSKIHDTRVKKLLKQRAAAEQVRLTQVARGERLAGLKEERKGFKKEITGLRNVIKKVETNPNYARLTQSDGSLPLRVALDENLNYPSENRNVLSPSGESISLTGPMYLPTGKAGAVAGGIRTEVIKEGSPGYQRASSEYYRDGDRHTIFSIRLLAKRIESDITRMANSEAYKAIIAQFGNKPLEVLGQATIEKLQKRAEEIALNYPTDRLFANYDSIVQQAIEAGEPLTDGIAAYAPGVRDPILALKLATQEQFGKLVLVEMQARALGPIDPYKSITAVVRQSSINEQTMFVPDYLRESIAAIEVVIDPTQWNTIVKGMNKLTSKFKTGTLVLSLSWQLGDLFTNVLLAAMVEMPVDEMLKQMNMARKLEYGTGFKGLWNMLDPRDQSPVVLTPIEAAKVRIAKESPVQDISLAQAQRRSLEGLKPDVEKPTKLNRLTRGRIDYHETLKGRSFVKILFKANETINRITRHGYFFAELEQSLKQKGSSLDEMASTEGSWRFEPELKTVVEDVAQKANDLLGDFSDLSLRERKYVVGQIPFYAWIKHVHKVFVMLGKEHPQSIAWYIYMGNFMYDPDEDPLGLRYGGINFFGGISSVNTFSPFADVVGGPIGSLLFENDLRPALNTLGPVPRLIGGLGLGFDVTKLEKVQRPSGTGQYTDTGIASGGSLLPIMPGGSLSQTLGFTLNQFPIAKRTLQILPGRNLPGTDIALGPTNTYLTGEARLDPTTRQRVNKWGGSAAAVARLVSCPLIPLKTERQIQQATSAARVRLASVAVLKKIREAQGTP